ncbi:unnamed protein product [Brassica oleracea var. botrytis]|uniref:(rape) hypothetical protein n=1 Tax=Brassica napus TaxID=3708 RepID=A0A816TTX0_BRANA|nr:unnamed protein product [Brassica napus]
MREFGVHLYLSIQRTTLLIIAGLIQAARKVLSPSSSSSPTTSPSFETEMAFSGLESRNAEVDGLVKATTSTMQHSDPYLVGKGSSWFATTGRKAHTNAVKMLSPSFGEPGQCFALKGSSGYVQIRLRGPIVPEAFTLEHVAKVNETCTV